MRVEILVRAKDNFRYRGIVGEETAIQESALRAFYVAGDPLLCREVSGDWIVFDDTTRGVRWNMFAGEDNGGVPLGEVVTQAQADQYPEALAEAFKVNRFVGSIEVVANPKRTKRVPLGTITVDPSSTKEDAKTAALLVYPDAVFVTQKIFGTKEDRPPAKGGTFYILTVTDAPDVATLAAFTGQLDSETDFEQVVDPVWEKANPKPTKAERDAAPMVNGAPDILRRRRYRLRLESLSAARKTKLWNRGRLEISMSFLAFVDKKDLKVYDGNGTEKYTITQADEDARARSVKAAAGV